MAITYLKRSPGIAPVDISETTATVAEMLARLESDGEAATRSYSALLGSWEPASFIVGADVIAAAKRNLSRRPSRTSRSRTDRSARSRIGSARA